MDPATMKLAGDFLGGVGKGIAGDPGPAISSAASPFDSSGWNVNFAAGNIESRRAQEQRGTPAGGDLLPLALVGLGLLVVWRMSRR